MKKINTKKIFLFVFTIFVMFACKKEEFAERGYPVIITREATNVTDTGAFFSAELHNFKDTKIVEYGFVWGITENIKGS